MNTHLKLLFIGSIFLYGTFLVDTNGKILAINPTVEEVEAQLNKLL